MTTIHGTRLIVVLLLHTSSSRSERNQQRQEPEDELAVTRESGIEIYIHVTTILTENPASG